MTSVRDTYGLPRRTPGPIRVMAFMLAAVAIWVLLWFVLPDGPVTVVVLVLVVLASLFLGIGRIMQSREFSDVPGRHPVAPPSTEELEPPPDDERTA